MKHPRYACCVPNHATIENDQKQLIQTPKGSDNSSKTKSIKSAGRKAASSAKASLQQGRLTSDNGDCLALEDSHR